MKNTLQQENAIKAPLGNILVSAGAGSGKTGVMTQRIARRIVEGETDIRNILVMTFTDAAAASMREKIGRALKKALSDANNENERRHIGRQILFLPQSNISTIHSFCLETIRNFFCDITDDKGEMFAQPGFTAGDPGECEILLEKTIDDIFDEEYTLYDEDPENPLSKAFILFTDSYGHFRSDQTAREIVKSFYKFLRSMPDYSNWIDEQREKLDNACENFSSSEWFGLINRGLSLRTENAKECFEEFKELIYGEVTLYKNSKKNREALDGFKEFIPYMEKLFSLVDGKNTTWDDYHEHFSSMPEIKSISARDDAPPEKARFVEIFRTHIAELLFYTTGKFGTGTYTDNFIFPKAYVFSGTKSRIEGDMKKMKPAIEKLFELALKTDEKYMLAKRKKNIIDFGDFEHIALSILRKKAAADYYKEKFKEIYIDEYQDTSSIQETIINSIASQNVFMVGDVKQSIYKFRHANPEIFMNKYKIFLDSKKGEGSLHGLNKNFRSTGDILESVNTIFARIMSSDAGEIEYDEKQALDAHRKKEKRDSPVVKILLADSDAREKIKEDITPGEAEAYAVADSILKLVQEGCEPKEIAVLARTKDTCKTFSRIIEKFKIPVETEDMSEFLEKYDLKVLQALLEIMDNPMQDIPLTSIMASPVLGEGFTEGELLKIRTFDGCSKYFHESVQQYENKGNDEKIKNKIREFMNKLSKLRERLSYRTVTELLEEAYYDSGLHYKTGAPYDKNERKSNAEDFFDWVRGMEERGGTNLRELTRLIREIKDKSSGKNPLDIGQSESNAVKIMTIHKSKGLEYKAVFLVGNNRRLSGKETKSEILFSEDKGIAFNFVDFEKRVKYPTPPAHAMKEEMKKSILAEEMRLLYVAMTRAMDLLYICGTVSTGKLSEGKDLASYIDRVCEYSSRGKIPGHIVLGAKNNIEWIMAGLSGKTNPLAGKDVENKWETRIVDYEALSKIISKTEKKEERKACVDFECEGSDEIAWEKAEVKFLSKYLYSKATATPLKTSVSEMKRKQNELSEEPDSIPIAEERKTKRKIEGINLTIRPLDKTLEEKMSGSEKGIAIHNFFRHCDVTKAIEHPGEKTIEDELERMRDNKTISAKEYEYLMGETAGFIKYYKSETAMKIFEKMNEDSVFIETPFTLKIKCSKVFGKEGFGEDDNIYMQGIMDCWYKENGRAVLLDYKSDRIKGGYNRIKKLLNQRYKTQMYIYAKAIEQIEQTSVDKAIIWHFPSGQAFKIDFEDDGGI